MLYIEDFKNIFQNCRLVGEVSFIELKLICNDEYNIFIEDLNITGTTTIACLKSDKKAYTYDEEFDILEGPYIMECIYLYFSI